LSTRVNGHIVFVFSVFELAGEDVNGFEIVRSVRQRQDRQNATRVRVEVAPPHLHLVGLWPIVFLRFAHASSHSSFIIFQAIII